MFSELIYTRCRQGFDITGGGRTISSDGYKVYSCSERLLRGRNVDTYLLHRLAGDKQSYSDPSFMVDAYLFLRPDVGDSMMACFHPIHFDKDATGDYSHRSGNYITQAYVGDFSALYPYELFGSRTVWDAKEKGEAFYYSTPPSPLPERSELPVDTGTLCESDVANFVAQGRARALATAVAFLIEQYTLSPKDRKYLVIRGRNDGEIERWIAAIESAFSPKIASGIPFASRLDNYPDANIYTVGADGLYMPQINLADKNQSVRLMAMLVGVDARDTDNANVRQMPNSGFEVLCSDDNTVTVSYDISHPYYRAITSFDKRHAHFCREFLQMMSLKEPSPDLPRLFEAFTVLESFSEDTSAAELARALSIIGEHAPCRCSCLERIYSAVKSSLPRLLRESPADALVIIDFLRSTAATVGDTEAQDSLVRTVNRTFAESLFDSPESSVTAALWSSIRGGSFFDNVATAVTTKEVHLHFDDKMCAFTSEGWGSFLGIYLECAALKPDLASKDLTQTVGRGLYTCYTAHDSRNALKICDMLEKYRRGAAVASLPELSENGEDGFSFFCAQLLLHVSPETVSDDKTTFRLCRELAVKGCRKMCTALLRQRAKRLIAASEQLRFLVTLASDKLLSSLDLSLVYIAIDANLSLTDKVSAKVASHLYEHTDEPLTNSAHVCALNLFEDKKLRPLSDTALKVCISQGFPSIADEVYAARLTDKILSRSFEDNEISYIINLFSRSDFYRASLVKGILTTAPKQNNALCVLLEGAVRSKAIRDEILSQCLGFKNPEKQLAALKKRVTAPEKLAVLEDIAEELRGRLGSSDSGRGGLFGFMSGKSRNK